MTGANGHSEQTTEGGDVGHSGADSGRVYSSDVRTLTTYEAYCSCGWSVVRSTWDDASKAVDKHDERHEEQR